MDKPADSVLAEGLAWIGRAQDHSSSADGGVACHYCLVKGWGTSYPETTGYIVPTLIREGTRRNNESLLRRARRMLDWLVRIQLHSGTFQGRSGWGCSHCSRYVQYRADPDRPGGRGECIWRVLSRRHGRGCGLAGRNAGQRWLLAQISYSLRYAGRKELRNACLLGTLEAARLEPARGYAEAAIRNIDWALSHCVAMAGLQTVA